MERFEKVYDMPYELLLLHFLSVAYPTKNYKHNVMEQFERVLDVTGSKFISDEDIVQNRRDEKMCLEKIESSIPRGMYLSDYPENHPIWIKIEKMHDLSEDNYYVESAQHQQDAFYLSLDEIKSQMEDFESGKPVVETIYLSKEHKIIVVALKGRVFEVDGDYTTEYYSANKDSIMIDEMLYDIQSRIEEYKNQDIEEK